MTSTSQRPHATDRTVATATIVELGDSTTVDADTGAVHSVQTAEMSLTQNTLEQLWSAEQLERLARTYWRFLSRVTLGLIRVHYSAQERFVVLLGRPFKLLTFSAPEYQLTAQRSIVRWRIERGLLVAKAGRGGRGHLQIELRRQQRSDESAGSGLAKVHIEVEVENFYPAIASKLSRRLYNLTQSKIHVIVTKAFLRSLTKLDFPKSKVGRFET
jgi:hypothetical protein